MSLTLDFSHSFVVIRRKKKEKKNERGRESVNDLYN